MVEHTMVLNYSHHRINEHDSSTDTQSCHRYKLLNGGIEERTNTNPRCSEQQETQIPDPMSISVYRSRSRANDVRSPSLDACNTIGALHRVGDVRAQNCGIVVEIMRN